MVVIGKIEAFQPELKRGCSVEGEKREDVSNLVVYPSKFLREAERMNIGGVCNITEWEKIRPNGK